MRIRVRSAAAIGVVVALTALGVSGCSIGPSEAQEVSALEVEATKAIPDLNGAFVSFSSEGSRTAILLILYTQTGDETTVTAEVDAGFRTMWKDAPFHPSSIAVGAVRRAKPAHPKTFEPNSFDPRPIAAALKFASDDTTSTWIDADQVELARHYGPWVAPAN